MRKSLILFMAIFIFVPSCLFAQGNVKCSLYVDPQYQWLDGDNPLLFVNTPLVMEIKFENGSSPILGYSFNFKISGKGGLSEVIWLDANDHPLPPAYEPSIVPAEQAESWMTHEIYTFGWDGLLPDTFAVSALDFNPLMPPGMELTTLYELHLMLFDSAFIAYDRQICFDGITWNGDYDWLFPAPVVFAGPACWDTKICPCAPAVFTEPFDTLVYQGAPFDEVYAYSQDDGFPPSFSLVDKGTVTNNWPIGNNTGELRWQYDPVLPITDWPNNENQVLIDPCGIWGCGIEQHIVLIFPSEPPIIDNACGVEIFTESESEYNFTLKATDPENEGILNWYLSADPEPEGTYSVTPDGLFTFTAAPSDIGNSYDFAVTSKDNGGNTSDCTMTVNVVNNPTCGDLNYDGHLNILDIIMFIDGMFKNGPPPSSDWIADVDGDGTVNILDAIYYIEFKFKEGPAPICPGM